MNKNSLFVQLDEPLLSLFEIFHYHEKIYFISLVLLASYPKIIMMNYASSHKISPKIRVRVVGQDDKKLLCAAHLYQTIASLSSRVLQIFIQDFAIPNSLTRAYLILRDYWLPPSELVCNILKDMDLVHCSFSSSKVQRRQVHPISQSSIVSLKNRKRKKQTKEKKLRKNKRHKRLAKLMLPSADLGRSIIQSVHTKQLSTDQEDFCEEHINFYQKQQKSIDQLSVQVVHEESQQDQRITEAIPNLDPPPPDLLQQTVQEKLVRTDSEYQQQVERSVRIAQAIDQILEFSRMMRGRKGQQLSVIKDSLRSSYGLDVFQPEIQSLCQICPDLFKILPIGQKKKPVFLVVKAEPRTETNQERMQKFKQAVRIYYWTNASTKTVEDTNFNNFSVCLPRIQKDQKIEQEIQEDSLQTFRLDPYQILTDKEGFKNRMMEIIRKKQAVHKIETTETSPHEQFISLCEQTQMMYLLWRYVLPQGRFIDEMSKRCHYHQSVIRMFVSYAVQLGYLSIIKINRQSHVRVNSYKYKETMDILRENNRLDLKLCLQDGTLQCK